MTARSKVIQHIAESILALPSNRIVRVAIDGDAGAGKTTLGDELAKVLSTSERSIIRASIDSFHHPREIRYRLGKTSPDGFYLDSYNYEQLINLLLAPLSPGGSHFYQRAAFDHRTDACLPTHVEHAAPDSILLFDGIFLHRPELCDQWDYSIYLDVSPQVGLARCAARGDGSPDPAAESNYRYVKGQERYMRECQPKSRATVVIDNGNLDNPRIV